MRYQQTKTLLQRFEEKVFPEPNTGCWLWGASTNANGYGTIKIDHKVFLAPRIAYQLYKKVNPEKLLVCHHCDNPACVNPDHLYLGDFKQNAADMVARGRVPYRKGVANKRAKFDESQVRAIRDAHNAGFKRDDIARYFKRPVSAIDDIIYNRSWTHLC